MGAVFNLAPRGFSYSPLCQIGCNRSISLAKPQIQLENRTPAEQLLEADFVRMLLKMRDAILAQPYASCHSYLGQLAQLAGRFGELAKLWRCEE